MPNSPIHAFQASSTHAPGGAVALVSLPQSAAAVVGASSNSSLCSVRPPISSLSPSSLLPLPPHSIPLTLPSYLSVLSSLSSFYTTHLQATYDSLGLTEKQSQQLVGELYEATKHLYQQFYDEAHKTQQSLQTSIDRFSKQIHELASILDEPGAVTQLKAIQEAAAGEAAEKGKENMGPEFGLLNRQKVIGELRQKLLERQKMSRNVVAMYWKEIQQLYTDLGLSQEEKEQKMASLEAAEKGTDLSKRKIEELKAELLRLHTIRTERVIAVKVLSNDILQLCSELEMAPDSFTAMINAIDVEQMKKQKQEAEQMDASSSSCSSNCISVCLDRSVSERLVHSKHVLTLEYQSREQRLADLFSRIQSLWQRLSVDEDEQQRFLDSVRPSSGGGGGGGGGGKVSATMIGRYEQETERLEALKGTKMQELIEQCRQEIQQLLSHLRFPSPLPSCHPLASLLSSTDFSESSLSHHEQHRDSLSSRYSSLQSILKAITLRENRKQELFEWELNKADPERFKGKKAYLVLAKEEKLRKMMEAMPKLDVKLHQQILSWEMENQEPFLMDGERYGETLREEIEEYEANKKREEEAKKEKRLGGTGGVGGDRTSIMSLQSGLREGSMLPFNPMSCSLSSSNTPSRPTTASKQRPTNLLPSSSSSSCTPIATSVTPLSVKHHNYSTMTLPDTPGSAKMGTATGRVISKTMPTTSGNGSANATPMKGSGIPIFKGMKMTTKGANKENY